MNNNIKPLGQKAYGSISHLPYSRLVNGDHHIDETDARLIKIVWATFVY